MLRDNKEYQSFAGANLAQAIVSSEIIVPNTCMTENETISEADADADSFKDSFVEPHIGQIGFDWVSVPEHTSHFAEVGSKS